MDRAKLTKKFNEALREYYKLRSKVERMQHDYDMRRAEYILRGVPGDNETERRAWLDAKLGTAKKKIIEARSEMLAAKAVALSYAAALGVDMGEKV